MPHRTGAPCDDLLDEVGPCTGRKPQKPLVTSTTGTVAPLTPKQGMAKAKKRMKVQQRADDEQARHSARMRDLSTDATD